MSTGLARSTLKKHPNSEETEPSNSKRGSHSKLDPYAEELAHWLDLETTKSQKQRRNMKKIYTVMEF
jgi:hypothetical protein